MGVVRGGCCSFLLYLSLMSLVSETLTELVKDLDEERNGVQVTPSTTPRNENLSLGE